MAHLYGLIVPFLLLSLLQSGGVSSMAFKYFFGLIASLLFVFDASASLSQVPAYYIRSSVNPADLGPFSSASAACSAYVAELNANASPSEPGGPVSSYSGQSLFHQ